MRSASPRLVFGTILTVYLLIHLGLRILEGSSLRWDESEQTLFTQQLALGYNDQPPVYTWLLWVMFRLTGVSLTGVYLFKLLVLAGLYWGMYSLGRKLMSGRMAILAALSVLLTPYFAWNVLADGAHTPFVAAFVPATFLAIYRLLDRPTALGFAVLGLVLGFGFLAKYSFALLAIALPIAMFTIPTYRSRLRDPRLLLTVVVGAIVVLPHANWVFEHWEQIRDRPMHRGGLLNPTGAGRVWSGLVNLAVMFGRTVGPLVLALAIVFPDGCWRALTCRSVSDRTRLLGRWLAVLGGMFLVLILLGVTQFRSHWLIPIVVVLPTYVFAHVHEQLPSERRVRGFAVLIGVALLAAAGVRAGLILKEARPGGKYWGREQMHSAVAARVAERGAGRATFVGDHPIACGNLRLRHPESRVFCVFYPAALPAPSELTGPLYLIWEITDVEPMFPPRDAAVAALGLTDRIDWAVAEYFAVPPGVPERGLRRIALVPIRAAGPP